MVLLLDNIVTQFLIDLIFLSRLSQASNNLKTSFLKDFNAYTSIQYYWQVSASSLYYLQKVIQAKLYFKVLLKEGFKLQLCMIHSSLGKNVFAPLSVNTFNMNNINKQKRHTSTVFFFYLWQSIC